ALRPLRRFRLDPIGDAITLGIGDSLLLALESEAQLLRHSGRLGPAHERIGRLRHLGLIFEEPKLRLAFAGLHGIAGGPVDLRGHAVNFILTVACDRWSGWPDSN